MSKPPTASKAIEAVANVDVFEPVIANSEEDELDPVELDPVELDPVGVSEVCGLFGADGAPDAAPEPADELEPLAAAEPAVPPSCDGFEKGPG